VFNLKRVPWIDTSGITSLMALKKRALDRGGDVVLLNPTGKTARILRSCLIQTYIRIYEDELTAVGSIRPSVARTSLDRAAGPA
jgi:anti-anti-sigma factor